MKQNYRSQNSNRRSRDASIPINSED